MSYRKVLFVIYFLALVGVAKKLYRTPEYNWDILPYMAVVLSYDNIDSEQAHNQAFETVKEELPPGKSQLLTDTTNHHRKQALRDPKFFASLYPMYVVKPLYTRLCWMTYRSGFTLTEATYLVSTISFVLIGMVLLIWISSYVKLLFAALYSIIVMLMPFMTDTARLSSPDMLSAMLIFTGVFFLIQKRQTGMGFLILILSLFARIDNIIPVMMILTGYKLFSQQVMSWKKYFLVITGILICFFYISSLATPFEFSPLYADSYVGNMKTADATTTLNTFDAKFLISQVLAGLKHSWLFIFAVLGLLCILFSKRTPETKSNWIILAIAISIGIRFLLQPLISDRFYIPYYLLIIVILLRMVTPLLLSQKTVNAIIPVQNSKP